MKQNIFTAERNFQAGDAHESIGNAREFLNRLGYISPAAAPALEAMTTFDDGLSKAVLKYQQFHGLKATGVIDEETRKVMEMPRCGVADLENGEEPHSLEVEKFVESGGKWDRDKLFYQFINGTNDLPGDSERDIVRQAFDVWAAVIPLTFTEFSGSGVAEFLISWVTGEHGDGNPFDGPGHTLAHAYFPPPINPHPGLAGDVHFDDAETWATSHGGGNIDLLSVAIHELGHALGLRHSNVPEAIMYPTYSGIKRDLANDDITGIQSIYPTQPKPNWITRFIQWLRRLFGLN